jgi:hypothetical protein
MCVRRIACTYTEAVQLALLCKLWSELRLSKNRCTLDSSVDSTASACVGAAAAAAAKR